MDGIASDGDGFICEPYAPLLTLFVVWDIPEGQKWNRSGSSGDSREMCEILNKILESHRMGRFQKYGNHRKWKAFVVSN